MPDTPAEGAGNTRESVPESTAEGMPDTPAEAPKKPREGALDIPVEENARTAGKEPKTGPEEPTETPGETAAAVTVLEVPELVSKSPAQETKPAAVITGSITESPMVQLEREFKQRARVIREQMVNIQNSFVTIGFQLHWIREHNMFRVMNYKSIYEYADKECGIGRSSCGNLISIIENFAERDENGQVIESITECYRNYSSSQLVAMVGMPESMKQQVTPDMSVRAIQKMRKGIPDRQATEAPEGKTAETGSAVKAESPANAEAAGQAPGEEKEQAASGTLFTFDCYSTYHKAQKKVNEMMEKVFSGNSPVTVKIVCVQG